MGWRKAVVCNQEGNLMVWYFQDFHQFFLFFQSNPISSPEVPDTISSSAFLSIHRTQWLVLPDSPTSRHRFKIPIVWYVSYHSSTSFPEFTNFVYALVYCSFLYYSFFFFFLCFFFFLNIFYSLGIILVGFQGGPDINWYVYSNMFHVIEFPFLRNSYLHQLFKHSKESSGAGMAPQSCPELGKEDWVFIHEQCPVSGCQIPWGGDIFLSKTAEGNFRTGLGAEAC